MTDDALEPDPVEVTWRLNASDVSSAVLAAFSAAPGMASIPIGAFLVFGIGLVVLMLRNGSPTALVSILLFNGILVALFVVGIPRLALSKIPEEERAFRLAASSRGVTIAQRGSQAQTSWTAIARFRKVRNGYALHLHSGGLQYVPDRAFSEEQRLHLLAWMAREGVNLK